MSSAASISAAKRRRGAQPTFTNQVPSNQSLTQQNLKRSTQAQAQARAQTQPQAQGPVRINPMAILENHERRLRDIEGNSIDEVNVKEDGRVNSLLKENEQLKNAVVDLTTKLNELMKVKDMVINIQSSVLSNTQKVETLKTEINSLHNEREVVTADVTQEIQDVTADMSEATISYSDEDNKQNVTFTVEEGNSS